MMRDADKNAILHAAELLEADARGILIAHTMDGNGDWTGRADAKADYDDYRQTARALRLYIANQKG